MNTIRLEDKEFELFIPENQIREAVAAMAVRIKKEVGHADPLFVCILNGAFMFAAELMKELDGVYEMAFARYSSYKGTCSTGTLNEILPVQANVTGRTLVLLEDIVDTGFTMHQVVGKLKQAGAADIKLAALLFKPGAAKCNLVPDYVGFRIPNDFTIGYGMDYEGRGRAYRDIYKLVKNGN